VTRGWRQLVWPVVAATLAAAAAPAASARATGEHDASADAPATAGRATPSARAPSGPPLSSAAAEEGGLSPAGEADPLVSNGLGSPVCRWAQGAELPAGSRSNCQTSGFAAAGAPTGDFGIDVHIDTGLPGLSSGWLLSTVQDLLIAPVWMGLVWTVHALVVMLEWCFTIDLLDSASAGGLGAGLRRAQASLTTPWLALALSVASIPVLYNGIVRRRVADTLGEALLMGAMMVGGLWAIADPMGTVGALGRWANQASLGTLAVAAQGSPALPGRALVQSMSTVFAEAIEGPWCYLEFGDVAWCRDPGRLEARLHDAGLGIAVGELAQAGCKATSASCERAAGSSEALVQSARLLRSATSNGAIFLALPANGPARNAINQPGSLLRTICQSATATDCRGPAAPEAEFRTNGGTWSRLGGLLLVAAGLLGMLLLLGFLASRLLAAALFSVLYLLLAPGVVLAPAFGESGRSLFRGWLARLVGAVVSKLVFSFLLGAVLAVVAILAGLETLGWWTQWLLMSVFWWSAYLRRHQVLGVAHATLGQERPQPRSLVRRVDPLVEARKGMAAVRRARERRRNAGAEAGTPETTARGDERLVRIAQRQGSVARRPAGGDRQAALLLAQDREDSRSRSTREARDRLAAQRSRLHRIGQERDTALAAGDSQRGARLSERARRLQTQIAHEQAGQARTRELASELGSRGAGDEALQRRGRFLDAQAALPSSVDAAVQRVRPPRDYRELAALVGYGRGEIDRLGPRRQREVRLEIDRELQRRRQLGLGAQEGISPSPGHHAGGSLARRRPAEAVKTPDRGPVPRRGPVAPGNAKPDESESPEWHDIREVAAGRKRQFGIGRP
jgi:hypothetical protein